MNMETNYRWCQGKEGIIKTSLYSLRTLQGKTQRQLAEYANITTRCYQYVEAGKKKPTIQIALRLAEVLGTTVEKIFTE